MREDAPDDAGRCALRHGRCASRHGNVTIPGESSRERKRATSRERMRAISRDRSELQFVGLDARQTEILSIGFKQKTPDIVVKG